MKKPLSWIPLWIDPWLFGSTRIELTLEQRAVWIDLLTLAGKDSGFIRANEGVPYPPEQLAGLLRVSQDILVRTIDRCCEVGKLERLPDGALRIAKWEAYRLTPQYRRRLKPPSRSSPLPKRKEEKRRGEESKGEGNTVSPPRNTVSKKGNKEEREEELPPIPRQAPFKVKDELKTIRHSLHETKRQMSNPDRWHSVEDLQKKAQELTEKYNNLVRDYAD
jgi:hypothetical protein